MGKPDGLDGKHADTVVLIAQSLTEQLDGIRVGTFGTNDPGFCSVIRGFDVTQRGDGREADLDIPVLEEIAQGRNGSRGS